jgi:hypothetical protein
VATNFMQTILAFFELWSVGFWLLIALSGILFTVAAERESHFLAATCAIVLGLLYSKHLGAIDYKATLAAIGIYFLLGAIWSLYRWAKYIKQVIEESNGEIKFGDLNISAKYQKSKICSWILYWPFSATWNLLEDVVVKIYHSLGGVYDKITKSILKSSGISE